MNITTTDAQRQPYPEWLIDAQWTLIRALEPLTTQQMELVLAQIRCWTIRQRQAWLALMEPAADASPAVETSIVEELEAAEAMLDAAEAAVYAWARANSQPPISTVQLPTANHQQRLTWCVQPGELYEPSLVHDQSKAA